MKRSLAKDIGYKKERIVLSDILPYEVPPFFSNRYFYNFLINNKICLIDNELQFKKDSNHILEKLVAIVFGIAPNKKSNKNKPSHDYFKLDIDKSLVTIPFKFRIAHKDTDFRELTVIHPINQLSLVEFYDKYKSSILYSSTISRFSLRKPDRVSSLKYFKDSTNNFKRAKYSEVEIIETSDKEYTSLKTYFSYKTYSNIHKFYESFEYHRAEKKFDNLLRFDISRCFDSIYTHTMPWALFNKKIVKENLPSNKDSFGGRFDKVMQQMNYNETNGIVIGPEFSRIFAELILQRIDKNVEKELFIKGFKYKDDYGIFRYVDDFFVFYNDENVKKEILSIYKTKLQEYNLYFNESKTKILSKPIITNITIAKEEIRKLIEYSMIFQLYDSEIKTQIGIKYFKVSDIITNYKVLLANTNTSYKDLQNYFLSVIFRKVKAMINKFQDEQETLLEFYSNKRMILNQLENDQSGENDLDKGLELVEENIKLQERKIKVFHKQLFNNFNEIIDLTFFIYSVLPRVTHSIKVCHILFRIIDFVKNQEKTKQVYISKLTAMYSREMKYFAFDFDKKHELFKKIYDGILIVFKKSASSEYAEIETLYLLPIVNELGQKHYNLEEKVLEKHFNISKIDTKNKKILNSNLNYFTIISLLNHIKREQRYNIIRKDLQDIILKKFAKFENNKAEDIFLLIDILTCPHIASTDVEVKNFRKKILDQIRFFDNSTTTSEKDVIVDNLEKNYPNWFYSWKGNDIGIELNTKRGHSVY
jgi:hypothetical protein